MPTARRRVRRRVTGAAVLVAAVALGLYLRPGAGPKPAVCLVGSGPGSYALDPAQAGYAATIAAVGEQLGLPDHGVTIALAAALQESKLANLGYGDLDSVGLFQQRPSQGWGSRAQLLDPVFAAHAFYAHLGRVPGWQDMAVADAAQAVQHSADGSAYAQWEDEARTLARALTGEVPAGLSCQYVASQASTSGVGLGSAVAREVGSADIGAPLTAKRGWQVASWLVGHGRQYRISSVSFDGQRWTATAGTWTATRPSAAVSYTLFPVNRS